MYLPLYYDYDPCVIFLFIDASSPPLRGCIAPLYSLSVYSADSLNDSSYCQSFSCWPPLTVMLAMAS